MKQIAEKRFEFMLLWAIGYRGTAVDTDPDALAEMPIRKTTAVFDSCRSAWLNVLI